MPLTRYFSASSGFFHASTNLTSRTPAYSFFSSSRIGAIILQGTHLIRADVDEEGQTLRAEAVLGDALTGAAFAEEAASAGNGSAKEEEADKNGDSVQNHAR